MMGPTASEPRTPVLNIRAGARVGRAMFTPDGQRIMAFIWEPCWPCDGPARASSALLQFDIDTGKFLTGTRLGQFRDENGTFALSPDGTEVAVRRHRGIHLHRVAQTGAVSPEPHATLPGSDGPRSLIYLDDARILATDGYSLVIYSLTDGGKATWVDSHGDAVAVSPVYGTVFVGAGRKRTPHLATHRLPGLQFGGITLPESAQEPKSTAASVVSAATLSPSNQWLATGDHQRDVWVWPTAEVVATLNSETPTAVSARRVATLGDWVSALAFVNENRLLAGGWDGVLLDIDLTTPDAKTQTLGVHTHQITSIDISLDGTQVVCGDEGGQVTVWDLHRDTFAEICEGGEAMVAAPWKGHRTGQRPNCKRRSLFAMRLAITRVDIRDTASWDAGEIASIKRGPHFSPKACKS